ncbi:tail protein [Lactobacillus phage 3-SAC12]|nr:tail protein [Lactobacillus phage 3-SAC12]
MYLARPYLEVVVKKGKTEKTFRYTGKSPYNGAVDFSSAFSLGTKPENNKLTFYNLTDSQFALLEQGAQVTVYGGFYNADMTAHMGGKIITGTIQSSTPTSYEGQNHTVEVTFNHMPKITSKHIKVKKVTYKTVKSASKRKKASGGNATEKINTNNKRLTQVFYKWEKNNPNSTVQQRKAKHKQIIAEKKRYASNMRKKASVSSKKTATKKKKTKVVKYVNLHFKKGTRASTIIRNIAKRVGLPIGKLNLEYDHKFANGYTVSKSPLNGIADVAKTANTPVYFLNGKIYVQKITASKKKKIILSPETGLTSSPTPSGDGAYKGMQMEAQCLMRYDIGIGTVANISSGFKKYGDCIIIGGVREFTSSTATVTFQFVPLKVYNSVQKENLSKDKKKSAKDRVKAKKDANKIAAEKKRRRSRKK